MKVQKILVILMIVIFSLINTVVAVEPNSEGQGNWTDFSNATLKVEIKKDAVESEESIGSESYYLSIENVSFSNDENTKYYVFIANSTTTPTLGTTEEQLTRNATKVWGKSDKKQMLLNNYMGNNKDMYIWIVEGRTNAEAKYESKEVLSASKIEIESTEIGKIGSRILTNFRDKYTYIYVDSPCKSDAEVEVKIGKVRSKKIVKSIKDKEEGSLEDLLEYSKKTQPVYSDVAKIGINYGLLNDFDLEEQTYYYAYTKVENNKNESIEDVSLYQTAEDLSGVYGDKVDPLVNHKSSQFKWYRNVDEPHDVTDSYWVDEEEDKKEDDNKKDETNKKDEENNKGSNDKKEPTKPIDNTVAPMEIPNAGESKIIAIFIVAIVVIGIVIGIKYKKYNDIK